MTTAADNDKAALRERLRAQRAALDPAWAAAAGRDIVRRICALPALKTARRVAAYYAATGEPVLDDVIAGLLADGRDVFVPAFDRSRRAYRLCAAEASPPVPGRFGIREPAHPRWVAAPAPDLWLVPGIAFDRAGHRLGHGGGCFDRLLAHAVGLRAGIAFSFQILDRLAAEPHDVPMHLVITERETLP